LPLPAPVTGLRAVGLVFEPPPASAAGPRGHVPEHRRRAFHRWQNRPPGSAPARPAGTLSARHRQELLGSSTNIGECEAVRPKGDQTPINFFCMRNATDSGPAAHNSGSEPPGDATPGAGL